MRSGLRCLCKKKEKKEDRLILNFSYPWYFGRLEATKTHRNQFWTIVQVSERVIVKGTLRKKQKLNFKDKKNKNAVLQE